MTNQPIDQQRSARQHSSCGESPLEKVACKSHGSQDLLSQRGAMDLAIRLQAYWWERGYSSARFWAVPIDERFAKVGTYQLYCVQCNLVAGLPPDWRGG